MIEYVGLVPLLPLIGFVVNGLFGYRYLKKKAHWAAVLTTFLSFLMAFLIFLEAVGGKTLDLDLYTWVSVENFKVPFGFLVDPLSAVMMLVVTFVGFLIHVYSIGYMHDDPGYPRFFAYLNLFMVSMLVLVLANNYFLLFLGWEGVGLCSYLLIGYWFERKSAADAGKKAFIVNRVGDAGFLLGLFLIWTTFGSLKFTEVFPRVKELHEALTQPFFLGLTLVTWVTLFLFTGAIGKSAQIPLYVWLPDAMEGPTPVSALIHAATMVTAGVYMVARSAPLYNLAPLSLNIVTAVGALTAVLSASIALVQNDIKRVIAYSTISQLGYMFMGAGVGSYASGIFHLATHAFFKALLFLGAGSVIIQLHHEQDIRRMGGLLRFMPVTGSTFLIGAAANAGIFPLAGFWSKDEILFAAFSSGHRFVWLLGLIGAFMTAFYMFRLFFLVFTGEPRIAHAAHGAEDHRLETGDQRLKTHHSSLVSSLQSPVPIRESPPVITVPLMILAFFSVVAGFFGFPPEKGLYHRFVAPAFEPAHGPALSLVEGAAEVHPSVALEASLAALSFVVALAGIWVAYLFYLKRPELPQQLAERFKALYRLLLNKYWVDELYGFIFVNLGGRLCRLFWWLDDWVVDGAVNGASWLTVKLSNVSDLFDIRGVDGAVNGIADFIQGGSQVMRRWQTGLIQSYIFWMAAGIFGMVVVYLFL